MMLKAGQEFIAIVAAGAVHRLVCGSIDKFEAAPFDIGDGSFTLRWGSSPVHMDIYPDGVNFSGPGLDRRLE